MVLRKLLAVVGLSYIGTHALLVYHLMYSQSTDFQALVDRESTEGSESLKLSRKSLIEAVLGMYALQYSNDKMSFYSPKAVFDDPSITVEGRGNIATAFKSMESMVGNSVINPKRIAHGKDFAAIDILAEFTIKGLGYRVDLPTILVLKLEGGEGSEVIVRHYDKWYGKTLLGTEEPSVLGLGHVAKQFRRIHGCLIGLIFSRPSGLAE